MAVDEAILDRARGSERQAMEELLGSACPAIWRMACGLSGREDVGQGVVRFVLKQSLLRIHHWRDPDAAQRWFYHHTILTARRAQLHRSTPQTEVLVQSAQGTGPAYLAFIRALRGLPMQQQEAFLLHQGEQMTPRWLGMAMDCSTKAAQMHLEAAESALRQIAGADYPAMTDRLAAAYQRLTPADDLLAPLVRHYVAGALRSQRLRRLVRTILTLLVLGALAWAAWRFRHLLPSH